MTRIVPIAEFLSDEHGETAIEYALLASLVALAAIPALSGLGEKMSKTYGKIAESLSDAPPAPAGAPAAARAI